MYQKVKDNIHRGFYLSIKLGYIKAVRRNAHYNEDGEWIPVAYLIRWYKLKESRPYRVEPFSKFEQFVARMEQMSPSDKWEVC